MRTHYLWHYPLVIISCSYTLSDNGIVWFGPQPLRGPLVGCCQTMELFDLAHNPSGDPEGGPPCGVLSYHVIIWFNSYNLYNFCCPRVTHKPLRGPLWATTFSSPSLQHNFLLLP